MKFLQVRHATSILNYSGVKIIIDPIFNAKETLPPFPLTPNKRSNPIVDLITPLDTLLDIDVVLSTHIHVDHFDDKAKELLDKKVDVICQSNDEDTIRSWGFINVIPISDEIVYKGMSIKRVEGQHGTGETGKRMGKSSGYVLSTENEPTIYITGDTIYNDSVKENIERFDPEILIMNSGSPKFLNSDPIVMNIMDVEKTMKINPDLAFIIVHLDTFNHCIEKREDFLEYFSKERLEEMGVKKFYVPNDNESIELDKKIESNNK